MLIMPRAKPQAELDPHPVFIHILCSHVRMNSGQMFSAKVAADGGPKSLFLILPVINIKIERKLIKKAKCQEIVVK